MPISTWITCLSTSWMRPVVSLQGTSTTNLIRPKKKDFSLYHLTLKSMNSECHTVSPRLRIQLEKALWKHLPNVCLLTRMMNYNYLRLFTPPYHLQMRKQGGWRLESFFSFLSFDHVSLFYLTLVVLSHSSVNFLGMRLCHCKGTCSYIKRKTLLSTVLYYYDFITALDIATVIWIINPFCFIYFFPKLYIGQDTRDINIFS